MRQTGGRPDLRSVRLEGQSNASSHQTAAEEIHGPLPPFGLGLLAGLDAPEPAGGRFELRLVAVAAALSSGGYGEGSHGEGLAGASHRSQRSDGVSDHGHDRGGYVRGVAVDGDGLSCLDGWAFFEIRC